MYSLIGRPKVLLDLVMPVTLRERASAPLTSPAVRSSPRSQRKQFIEVPDPDFHDFDSSRNAKDIKPGQIWAIYDDKDGMPRYYGRIRSVSLSPFKIEFWWLVCDSRSPGESKLWTKNSGYYVATGKFENGEFSSARIINIFSHRMYVKEQFILGAPTTIIVYPRKGDVWAMYRDWDQVGALKSTGSPSKVACKFDLVEVLVDYSKENGVKTIKLAKMPNFRTVFQRQDGPQSIHIWKTSDLLRFSHTVPAAKIQPGNKWIGIPKQAMELDPAAIPLGYSSDIENGSGGDTEMKSQSIEESIETKEELTERGKGTPSRPAYRRHRQKPFIDIVVLALAQSHVESLSPETDPAADADDASYAEMEDVDQRAEQDESLILSVPAKVYSTSEYCSVSDTDFYDFNSLRTEADIEAGQIWAIYDLKDRMPRVYVRVVRVFGSPFKVELWRLKPQPPAEKMKSCLDGTGQSISCGRFKNDKREVMGLGRFSHLVLDRASDRVKIYPRKGEVWAMYRNWDLENGGRMVQPLATVHISGYDFVEILSDCLGGERLQMVRLAEVIGFKSLFQRQGEPFVTENVRPDLLIGFSHSIPARRMYKDDTLHIPFGAVEVDPAGIPLYSSPVPLMELRAPQNEPTID